MSNRTTVVLARVALLFCLGALSPVFAQKASYVGSSVPSLSSGAVTSITLAAPANLQVGDYMIAYVAQNYGWMAVNQVPAGWNSYQYNFTTNVGMALYYRVATSADATGAASYTWTFGESARTAGAVIAFRGLTSGWQIAASNIQGNAAGIYRTAPSVTPGVPDTMLVTLYAFANGSPDTLTAPTGMTQAYVSATGGGTSGVGVGGFYELLSASTATGNLVATSGSSISATSIGSTFALIPVVGTPLAQWHFDESVWSGVAGEVIDSAGSGYNGVAEHAATTAATTPALAGTTGTCGYGGFNGSTQYVQMPASLPHVGSTFTVTAWIRPSAYTNGRIWIDDEKFDGYALSFGDGGTGLMRFFSRSPYTSWVDAYASLNLNQWYFVAGVMDATTNQAMYLYIFDAAGTLVNLNSTSRTAFSAGSGANAAVGGNADGAVEGAELRFQGNIDEITVYSVPLTYNQVVAAAALSHSCGTTSVAPNHYAVSTAGTALTCQAAPVTIAAHSSNHADVTTTNTITLGTSTGHGDWSLTTGAGIFTAGASNSGAATYTFATGDDGTVVLALRDTYAETLTIGANDGVASVTSGAALASEDTPLTFVASGFRFTNGSNVAATIGTQVAGVTSIQSLALQAVRTDTNTGACTTAFASGATVNVGLAYQCNNPAACIAGQTFSLTNNGTTTSLAANSSGALVTYTTIPLKFSTANAEAPLTLNYSDVGQITLAAKYAIPLGSGAGSGNTMTGAGQFVVQPYTLTLSNIKSTSSGTVNPAAGTASGRVFAAAGQPFTTTVSATNYFGKATPNFGLELSPATVAMAPALVLPATGDDPPVSGSFGSFANGSATGTAFAWPEAGVITLTPAVANYLASGAVTGTTSANVGRFVPNAFATTLNSPVFGTGCTAGGFTYLGQPFTYLVTPVITVTALAVGGATTLNYTGALMRLSNNSLTGRAYTPTPVSPALILTGLPPAASDPAIADLGTGQATLTFGSGSGLSFARGTAIAPFSANITLTETVIDLDGVTAANPVTFGAGGGIAFSTGATQMYGRLALGNALGSELIDLPVSLSAQYYLSTTQGFVTNIADSCTAAPPLSFSGYQQALAAGQTCVRDSGNPGISGIGCPAAAANASRYAPAASAGAFNLHLAAPGSGNAGALTVTAIAPSWLQYLWSAGVGTNASPSALATFGLFPGSTHRVYQREVY